MSAVMEGLSLWEQYRGSLQARAAELAADGFDQETIMRTLEREYPGLPNDRYYLNPAAIAVADRARARQREAERQVANEAWRASKGLPPLNAEPAPPPAATPPRPAMSGKMLAFAGAHGYRCGVCGREGDVFGDADGDAWRQHRPPQAGRYVLACTACAGKGGGHADGR